MNQSLHKLQAAQMPTLARNSWAALLLGRDAWKRCQFPRAHPPCISLSFQTGTLSPWPMCPLLFGTDFCHFSHTMHFYSEFGYPF